MKPVLLELSGFGPFVEETKIDFSSLDRSSLFLVFGPTGAGKTTIFDAICYALYGETSGGRSSKDMVSDYERDEQSSRVSFTFQIGQKFYRTERKIAQDNKPDKVSLEFLDRDFIPVAPPVTKIQEMRARVEDILGFSADQFQKVIMLPQGEFERLLMADTNEREKILTKLFDADIYAKISARLDEKAKEKKKELEHFETRVNSYFETLGVSSTEQLEEKSEAERTAIAELAAQEKLLEAEFRIARSAHEEAKMVDRLFVEFASAEANLERQLQSRAVFDEERIRLERAERAEPLRAPMKQLREMHDNALRKEAGISEKAALLEREELNSRRLEEERRRIPQLRAEIEGFRIEEKKLAELKPKILEREELRTGLAAAKRSHDEQSAAILGLRSQIEGFESGLQRIEENIPALEKSAANFPLIAQVLDSWRESARLRSRLREDESTFAQRDETLRKLYGELEDAAKEREERMKSYNTLDMRWRRSQAALLAETLAEGEACPVCGSEHHPQPAGKTEEYVSTETLDEAKSRFDATQNRYESVQKKYEQARTERDDAESALRVVRSSLKELAEIPDESFAAQLAAYEQEHREAQEAKDRLETLKAERADMISRKNEAEIRLHGEEEQLREKYAAWQGLEARFAAMELPGEYSGIAQIEARLNAILAGIEKAGADINRIEEEFQRAQNTISSLRATIEAEREFLAGLQEEKRLLQESLKSEVDVRAFASIREAAEFLLDEGERARLRARIQQWDEEFIRCEAEKQRTERNIAGKQKPELQQYRIAESEKETAWQQAKDRIAQHEAHLRHIANIRSEIEKLHAQQEEFSKKASAIIELAELAKGKNPLNQKFQTFVVSSFLDEILIHANQRLGIMSQGRYMLRRSEDIVHKARKTGLDLNIFDNNTSELRPVNTLSGGEKFYTSLALALGLADVATAHAGGRRLESMFIDEGFGTLDSNTLDLAIQTLMDLQEGGRLVGIISHVEGLKERIPVKLEVVKRHNGSFLKWHGVESR